METEKQSSGEIRKKSYVARGIKHRSDVSGERGTNVETSQDEEKREARNLGEKYGLKNQFRVTS